MIHIHHVNLQPIVGGGEIYTRVFTRALADAGAKVTLYVHPDVRLWDDLEADRIDIRKARNEPLLLERLPRVRSLVLTQSPITLQTVERMAVSHCDRKSVV